MSFECPLPLSDYPSVQLAHGGGGRMTQMLLDKVFRPAFRNDLLEAQHDGARIGELAFTTDSFVVRPLFFPGGNIGSLAVHGTLNDLAMCGAKPLALSAGFILEEGFAMESLWRIVCSMRDAVGEIPIATGDTKVVDRGKGDGCYINTTGIGVVRKGITIDPRAAKPGDAILLSGEIATHGIAILSVREGLEFETAVETDSAWLGPLVEAVLDVAEVRVLRDPTRGGVASTLHEIAQSAGVGIKIAEAAIPVRAEVRGACEILGLDPLYVANEGKCLAIVAAEDADKALAAMRSQPLGRQAARIGEVVADHAGSVRLKSSIGGERIVDLMSGEQLPRIC
ncbi:MAG: hydrogenase expression/formation protein HypE [Planctomycetota bacterium]|jgi:hydrogenase expression/formation protein HypE